GAVGLPHGVARGVPAARAQGPLRPVPVRAGCRRPLVFQALRRQGLCDRLKKEGPGCPGPSSNTISCNGYLSALYLNFWPLTDAPAIRPPLVIMNTAIPLCQLPLVFASFLPPLAPASVPVVPVSALAEAVIATASTPAPNSKLPPVNSSSARLSLKKM